MRSPYFPRTFRFTLAALFLLSWPLDAQFKLTTVALPPPNTGIPFWLNGISGGKAVGNFILSDQIPRAMAYDLAAAQIDLDLYNALSNTVSNTQAKAMGTDGVHHAGYEVFFDAFKNANHNRCAYWTEGAAGAQYIAPPGYADTWCTAMDGGVEVGTNYNKEIASICGNNVCIQIVEESQFAVMTSPAGGASILTLPAVYPGCNYFTLTTTVPILATSNCFTRARAIRGGEQVGEWDGLTRAFDSGPDYTNPTQRAALWHGSSASFVDLHPAGYFSSAALATNGFQEGGWGLAGGQTHALLWSGTAASVVDLSPPGYFDTRVTGVSTVFQAGDGWVGGPANSPGSTHHGLVWKGAAASVIDLNQFLPAGYPHLTVTGVDADGNIAGYMQQDFNGSPAVNTEVGVILSPIASTAVASFTITPSSATAGAVLNAVVTLGAPAPAGGAVINFVSSNNALVPAPAAVTIPGGVTSATVALPTSATTLITNSTSVAIVAQSGFTSRSATVSIVPATAPVAVATFAVNPTTVAPGDQANGVLTLTAPAPAGGVLVNFSSSNTNVVSTPPSFVVPAGQSSASFSISTVATPLFQPASVVLQAAAGNVAQQATLTVASIAKPNSVFLGTPQNALTSVQGATSGNGFAPFSAVSTTANTLTLTNTNPALAVPATVAVTAGQSSAFFTYSTLPVSATTTGTLTATMNGVSVSNVITVTPSPSPAIQALNIPLVSSTQTWSSGQTLTGTVVLTGPAFLGGMTVSLASDTPAAQVPPSVVIAGGTTSATFSVVAGQVAGPANVTISATLPGFAPVTVTLTVIPGPALAITGYTLSPYTMIGPGVTTTGTLTLNQPAPAGGVTVAMSASNTQPAKFPASVTLVQGQTSASFTVQGNSVSGVTPTTLIASYKGPLAPLGTSAGTTLTVSPTDTLKIPSAPTWSKSTQILTVTATSTNPQAIVTVLNANGNVPLGTMNNPGNGSYSFQVSTPSIASVNLKSSLGGATGQGVTVVP